MPRVSIVLPTYNREASLPRAMESVLGQTVDDWELIVVDDASTDETKALVMSYADRRVVYIERATNGGETVATNTGFDAVTGEYCGILHSDDAYTSDFIETNLAIVDATDREVLFTDCAWVLQISDGPARVVPPITEFSKRVFIDGWPDICMSNHLFLSSAAKSARLDETLGSHGEWDLLFRLLQAKRGDQEIVRTNAVGITIFRDEFDRPRYLSARIDAVPRLLAKHQDEFSRHRISRSSWELEQAENLLRAGEVTRAGKWFLRSWRDNPKKFVLAVMAASTLSRNPAAPAAVVRFNRRLRKRAVALRRWLGR